MNSVLHIVIVWSTASSYKERIISDIKERFELQRIIRVHWDDKFFYENLKIFYSHSLKDKSHEDMDRIIKGKIKSIGKDCFYVIVFKDNNPKMEERITTSGRCVVNTNIFDIKERYRKLTGGSNIHSSNDDWETNKDLTLLFGKNSMDFLKQESTADYYDNNCIGVQGYDSLEQLFYVLNNTIDYCVLRNYEGIPEQYTLVGHDDIDLLVAHRNYAVRLTNAKPKFKDDYRVYHYVAINGIKVAFDFRHIGDDYYAEKWERDILMSRTMTKGLFYIPSPAHRYYSLLYHVYVQKPIIKKDYFPKLDKYAKEIGVVYKQGLLDSMLQLNSFIISNDYSFTRAKDKSVFYNEINLMLLDGFQHLKTQGFKELDSINEEGVSHKSGYVYFCGLYKNQKVFVKYGGMGDTCKNEYLFTKRLWQLTPAHYIEPILLGHHNNSDYLVQSFCEGVSLDSYLEDEAHRQEITKQLVDIYKELQNANVIHRDIRPENFVVADGRLKLFDFQYAIDSKERKELECMKNNERIAYSLGDVFHYRYKPYAWRDSYSFLQVAKTYGLSITEQDLIPKDKVFYTNLFHYSLCYFKQKVRAVRRLMSNK